MAAMSETGGEIIIRAREVKQRLMKLNQKGK